MIELHERSMSILCVYLFITYTFTYLVVVVVCKHKDPINQWINRDKCDILTCQLRIIYWVLWIMLKCFFEALEPKNFKKKKNRFFFVDLKIVLWLFLFSSLLFSEGFSLFLIFFIKITIIIIWVWGKRKEMRSLYFKESRKINV